MSQTEFQQKVRDRAIRLFTYLQELVQLRTPQVRDVESYEAVIWFSEIPQEDECYSISRGSPLEDTDVWLEIKKRKEPVCPALPAACRGWIDPRVLLRSEGEPRLLDRIFAPKEDEQNSISQPNVSAGAKIPIVPVEFSPPLDVVHRSLLRMEEVPRLVKGERRGRTEGATTARDEHPGDQ